MPETRWSLIQRLGASMDTGEKPGDPTQWRCDLEDFVRDYRAAIIAVCRVRQPQLGAAENIADSFLSDLTIRPERLRGADPERGRFRCYLHGWLKNYTRELKRRDLTREHRALRAGDVHEETIPKAAAFDEVEQAEQRAWALALVRLSLARFGEAREGGVQSEAWLISRYKGIPLPGDEPSQITSMDSAALARQLGIKPSAMRMRFLRATQRFRQWLLSAVDDTAASVQDTKAERAWCLGVLAVDYPELGADSPSTA